MDVMFWVWLSIMIGAVVLEIITADLVSVWFAFGAIIPCILAASTNLHYGWQIVIFLIISAILIASLRKITLKFLFKNANVKTNKDALIGQKVRLLETTDFETIGKVKIKDVEWSAVGEGQQTIEKGKVVEIVSISGNKLVVKETKEETNNTKDIKNNKGDK